MRWDSVSSSSAGDPSTCRAACEPSRDCRHRALTCGEMGILAEDVQRVREATDIVALAGEHIALKRVGRSVTGLCPFHTEKSPSFSISPEKNVWYCFGCQKSGDAITFIRELEHLDFVEAVERLAARSGITLRYDDVSFSKERQHK